jgi:DNA replication and repair protein RecF
MWVKGLSLKDFRNFTTLQAELSPGINILHGDNAQGKTNFLEAIYFCATGRSRRAGDEMELIRFGQRESHLRAEVVRSATSVCVIDAHLQHTQSSRHTLKGMAVDHLSIRQLGELSGILTVVTFSPEDMSLIKSGPAERRAFMDRELCQISPVYYHALRQYTRALKQRNNLLKILQKNPQQTDTVGIWNEQLCQYGRKLMASRADFTKRAGEIANALHLSLTGGAEQLSVVYRPHIANPDDYAEKLERGLARDIMLGSTYWGVHKDDILFLINNTEARVYGSQGQQRTAALSVKLAEINIIRESLSIQPVLLLDDVLSELDGHRQSFLLSRIEPLQTILACTGVEDILKKNAVFNTGGTRIMQMVNGTLIQ